jgi:REP-associated tyrosine transposase
MFYIRRRSPIRPPECAGPGMWFLTINAFESAHSFGSVVDSRAQVNAIGAIVRDCWQQVPAHFPHSRIDEFIVMPSHMHSILHLAGATAEDDHRRERFGAPVHGSVATIVRSFKAAVTREARQRLGAPVLLWQKGYHALRIVDRDGLERARRYIQRNPARWTESHPPAHNVVKEIRFQSFAVAGEDSDDCGVAGPTR